MADLQDVSVGATFHFFSQDTWIVCCQTFVALGIGIGIAARSSCDFSEVNEKFIGFPVEIQTRMFQLVSVPLLMSSVILGVCRIRVNFPKRIAVRAAVYFVLTTLMSVAAGLTLMLILKPGVTFPVSEADAEEEEPFISVESIMDLFRNMFPKNLLLALFQQNTTEHGLIVDVLSDFDILGLLIISLVLGLAISRLAERGLIFRGVVAGLDELIRYSITLVLGYLPVGLLLVSVTHVVEVGDWEIVLKLGKFAAVVLVGLILHAAVVLPLLYFVMVRRNPMAVIRGVYPALVTAFFLSSSSSALPLTYRCCEEQNRIDRRITGFVLPMANNVNKDGTALYQAAAAVFIAQLSEISVNLRFFIIISVTVTVSTLGAASVPGNEAMITLFVLTMVRLPLRDVILLVLLEMLLDRCSVLVNVLGDCVGAALLHQMSKDELEETSEQDEDGERWYSRSVETSLLTETGVGLCKVVMWQLELQQRPLLVGITSALSST
ncbi:excitatory amino acid transporter 3-like [Leuresthes tenuis]|uniref:excitatory amino acid transporter 3-like n=1 Tax=Leuresthes tenuis TaxID=355514 RepID=UPI003B5028FF